MSQLLWFVHFHKCAGTSLVKALLENGHNPPPLHANGNPLDQQGKPINFDALDKKDLKNLVDKLLKSGTTFCCSEFSHPKLEWLKEDSRIKTVTILRHPIKRMISNWKFDFINDYHSGTRELSRYTRQPYPWCSTSYYTNTLAAMIKPDSTGDDGRSSKENALQAIKYFDMITIQENTKSMQDLASELGLTQIRVSNKTNSYQDMIRDCLSLRITKAWRRLILTSPYVLPGNRNIASLSQNNTDAFEEDLCIYNTAQQQLA